jgi:hypothetical protein
MPIAIAFATSTIKTGQAQSRGGKHIVGNSGLTFSVRELVAGSVLKRVSVYRELSVVPNGGCAVPRGR